MPLYTLLLLSATLSPFWVHYEPRGIGPDGLSPLDLFLNVLLFTPLGVAFRSWRAIPLAAVALLVSGGIEIAQLWLPRISSPADVAANVAGALLGRFLPTTLWPRLRPGWLAAGLATASAAMFGLVWALHAQLQEPGFSSWEDYPLLAGNELTGDRPWFGVLREVAIFDYPRTTEPDRGCDPSRGPCTPWESGGPVLWAHFAPPASGWLDGPDGPHSIDLAPPGERGDAWSGEGLVLDGGLWQFPEAAARHVRERLAAKGKMSLWVSFRSDDPTASGPARIVSQSLDPAYRNFTLGQVRRNLVFRVRTPGNGENGDLVNPVTRDEPIGSAPLTAQAVYDGEVASIYVDGELRGKALVALTRAPNLAEYLGLAIVICTAFPALAAAALYRSNRRPWRDLCLVAAGSASWLVLLGAGVWSYLSFFMPIAVLLGIAAIASALPIARILPSRAG